MAISNSYVKLPEVTWRFQSFVLINCTPKTTGWLQKADSCCESPKQMLRGFSLSQEVYEITPRMQSTSQFIFHPHWLNPSFWVGIIPDKLQMVRIIPAEEMSQSQQRPVAGKGVHRLFRAPVEKSGDTWRWWVLYSATSYHINLDPSYNIFHDIPSIIIAWVSHSYPIRWYKVPWHHACVQFYSSSFRIQLRSPRLIKRMSLQALCRWFSGGTQKTEDVINSDEHEHGES